MQCNYGVLDNNTRPGQNDRLSHYHFLQSLEKGKKELSVCYCGRDLKLSHFSYLHVESVFVKVEKKLQNNSIKCL